ncbi:unnamed protein product, partial [Staurois parvus]
MAEWEQWEAVTGTHDTLWTQQQRDQAVYGGPWQIWGLAAPMGGPVNLPATYDKMETSRSVRRPESGTWQSGMETMGGGTGTHDTLWTQ